MVIQIALIVVCTVVLYGFGRGLAHWTIVLTKLPPGDSRLVNAFLMLCVNVTLTIIVGGVIHSTVMNMLGYR